MTWGHAIACALSSTITAKGYLTARLMATAYTIALCLAPAAVAIIDSILLKK